jgi:hypothetical protein
MEEQRITSKFYKRCPTQSQPFDSPAEGLRAEGWVKSETIIFLPTASKWNPTGKPRACLRRSAYPPQASGGGASRRQALRHAGVVPNHSPCWAISPSNEPVEKPPHYNLGVVFGRGS